MQVARVQLLLPSSQPESVIPITSLVTDASSPIIPDSSLVISAQAGIHRGRRSAPPTTTDLPNYASLKRLAEAWTCCELLIQLQGIC